MNNLNVETGVAFRPVRCLLSRLRLGSANSGYALLLFASLLCLAPQVLSAECRASFWMAYNETSIYRVHDSKAYFYVTRSMRVAADGAPNAYHPDDIGLGSLEALGYPEKSRWRKELVIDPANPTTAFVQPSGEYAGYFLSRTRLQDSTRAETDPARQVDSRNTPFLVLPSDFWRRPGTGRYGDFGMALNLNTGQQSSLVLGDDEVARDELGAVSIRLAESLSGHNVIPRTGDGVPVGTFLYLLFPHTHFRPPWPLTQEQIQARSKELLDGIGGWDSILGCVTF